MNKMLTKTNQFNEPNSFSIQGKKTMIHTILKSHYAIKAFSAALALVGLLALAGQSQAASLIYETQTNDPNPGTVVLTNDLLETQLSSVALVAGDGPRFGSSVGKLYDGTLYNGFPTDGTVESLAAYNGSTYLFTLNAGYNISQIRIYTGSGAGQTRSGQNSLLEYATTTSGSTFTPLFTSLDTGNVNNPDTANTQNLVIVSFTSGEQALSIDRLRFTVYNVGGDESMYREMDVIAVPEPSSAIMLVAGIGALIILRYRRLRA